MRGALALVGRRFAFVLLAALVGLAPVPVDRHAGVAIAASSPSPLTGEPARGADNIDAQYVSADDPTFFAPYGLTPSSAAAKHYWLPCTLASGSTALNVGTPVNAATTVTINQGQKTVVTSGAIWLFGQSGEPVTFTVGAQTFSTTMAAYYSTTSVQLTDAAPFGISGAAQVKIGYVFSSSDSGSIITIGQREQTRSGVGNGGAYYQGTLTYVDPADVTLSTPSSAACATSQSNWVWIGFGKDASGPMNAAGAAAAQVPPNNPGFRRLSINGTYMAPSLNEIPTDMVLTGDGDILASPFDITVIPTWAPAPAPPRRTLVGKYLFNYGSAASPKCVFFTDSRGVDNSPGAEQVHFVPSLIDEMLRVANPDRPIQNCVRRGIGGTTIVNADTKVGGFPTNWGLGSVPWISGAIVPQNADLVIVDFGINDSLLNFPTLNWVDMFRQLTSTPHPMDILGLIPTQKSNSYGFTTGSPGCSVQWKCGENWRNVAFAERSYYDLFYPNQFIDDGCEVTKQAYGYDPCNPTLVRWPYLNTANNGATQSLMGTGVTSWNPPIWTTGYSLVGGNLAVTPPNFATQNGEIQHQIGFNDGDLFRIGEIPAGLPGAGDMYYEADKTNFLPGYAIRGPKGAMPVTVLSLSTVVATAASNAVSTSVGMFTAAMESANDQLVVPGASATQYGVSNEFNDYLRCSNGAVPYFHVVDSEHVTLFADSGHVTACNAGASVNTSEVLLLGEPRIDSGVTISGDASSGTEYFFAVTSEGGRSHLRFAWQGFDGNIYDGPVWREGGAKFPPRIARTASGGNYEILNDVTAVGIPAFYIEEKTRVASRLYSETVFGNNYSNGDSAAVQGPYSGNNQAHQSTRWASLIGGPENAAQDWTLGPQTTIRSWVITGNALVATLPANVTLTGVYITETAGNAVTGGIQLGTTPGGSDVLGAWPVNASSQATINPGLLLKQALGGLPIYISAASAWNGASVNVVLTYVRTQ